MTYNFNTLFYDDYYDGVKWAASGENVTVTWSYVSDTIILPWGGEEISVNVPDNETIAFYKQAFKLWDNALTTLTFQQTSNGNGADVAVGIVDNLPNADGWWNSTWNSGIINNSSIRLDKDILATPNLLTTLLHEIGNVLGLGDIQPSSTIRSVQEDPFPEDFTGSSLWPDDVAMIKQLYEEPFINTKDGAIYVVNKGTSDAPVLDFYLDKAKDPDADGVENLDVTLKFDPSQASFTSFSYADGFVGAANELGASNGEITFGAFTISPIATDQALFSMTMTDLNASEDFSITISDLNVDGHVLEGSIFAIGATSGFTVNSAVVSRSGVNIVDADVIFSNATNSTSFKSTADGSVSGVLTAGIVNHVNANLSYSSANKATSSQDALDALKLSVGLTPSQGTTNAFDYISADFNQDGKVSSQDALSILKYSVGLPTSEQAKWVFVDTNGDYSGVSKSNTSYREGVTIADLTADTSISLTGILIGDVNDSYSGLIA